MLERMLFGLTLVGVNDHFDLAISSFALFELKVRVAL